MISIEDFLKVYCRKSSTDENGCKRSEGLTTMHGVELMIPKGFDEVAHWKDGQFRTVWINDDELTTITYCEGDISVMQHTTQASYDIEIVKAAEFYKAMGGGLKYGRI